MKKNLVIFALAAAVCLAACGNNNTANSVSANSINFDNTSSVSDISTIYMTGVWDKPSSPALTNDAEDAFEKAVKTQKNAACIPVALLGTQSGDEKKYEFLCRMSPSDGSNASASSSEGILNSDSSQTTSVSESAKNTPDSKSALNELNSASTQNALNTNSAQGMTRQETWALVTVREDSDGNAEISGILDSGTPTDISDAESLTGGWEAAGSPVLTKEEKDIFDKALSSQNKKENLKPIAILSSQVVAGENYCYFAETDNDAYVFVYIYEDLQGNASITDTVNFRFG